MRIAAGPAGKKGPRPSTVGFSLLRRFLPQRKNCSLRLLSFFGAIFGPEQHEQEVSVKEKNYEKVSSKFKRHYHSLIDRRQ